MYSGLILRDILYLLWAFGEGTTVCTFGSC
jgi:hypothetical protein